VLKQHDVFEMETSPDDGCLDRADAVEQQGRVSNEINLLTVSRVTQDDESTIIWVNCDHDLLAKALSSSI
jgi:hypothetical protein